MQIPILRFWFSILAVAKAYIWFLLFLRTITLNKIVLIAAATCVSSGDEIEKERCCRRHIRFRQLWLLNSFLSNWLLRRARILTFRVLSILSVRWLVTFGANVTLPGYPGTKLDLRKWSFQIQFCFFRSKYEMPVNFHCWGVCYAILWWTYNKSTVGCHHTYRNNYLL